jgi:Cu(I)/Ag(I) efflux system protein CusF
VESRCLCGEAFPDHFHHRDTEDAQRHKENFNPGRYLKARRLARSIQFLLLTLSLAFLSCQKPPPVSREQPPAAASPTPAPVGLARFPPPVFDKPYPGTGVVDLINKKEGWIEITHQEIKDLMPAMQMEFNVKDRALLDKVNVGDRVDFTIVETAKGEYLTEIKQADSATDARR